MFGTIRKHQKWLWAIIITITIISFVVFFSPNARLRGTSEGANLGSIGGKPITTEQYRIAYREAQLFYYIHYGGRWPESDEMTRQLGFDLDREVYRRLLIDEKARQLNIRPNAAATADWITRVFTAGTTMPFNQQAVQNFIKTTLNPHHVTAEDFYDFAQSEVAREQMILTFGLTGRMVTPQEAEFLYREQNEPLSAEVVFFTASNFLSRITITPEALATYYTNHQAEYRIPDRRQVSYVKFDMTNFLAEADQQLAQITNLAAVLDQEYIRRGANYYKDTKGNPLPPEEARKKIKEEERDQLALLAARKRANTFLNTLFQEAEKENKKSVSTEDFEKFAASSNFVIRVTPPFDERAGPADLKVPTTFERIAFRLGEEGQFVAPQAIAGEDGVYLIALKNRIPWSIPSFEAVREKVTEDYKMVEARKAAVAAGGTFDSALTNALAAGKKFEAVVAEQKVTATALPPFSASTKTLPELENHVSVSQLAAEASRLAPGQASRFQPTAEGGFVVFLKGRLPVDETKLKSEMPEFLALKREERMRAVFGDWFDKLSQQMGLVLPPRAAAK